MAIVTTIGNALRWVADAAAMAVGVMPGGFVATEHETNGSDSQIWVREAVDCRVLNPATQLPMVGDDLNGFDILGNRYGMDDAQVQRELERPIRCFGTDEEWRLG